MFVARVALGNTYICQVPKLFKRGPCTTCFSDQCTNHHTFFHSVIGTLRIATMRLMFREFVVYTPDQSYPEFLVEYERS